MDSSRAVANRSRACRSPELIQQIYLALVAGFSLTDCSSKLSFSLPFFYDWIREDPEAAKLYARAKEIQAENLAEEIVKIADSEPDPNKARVRVDARKWVAAKLLPKKYGDNATQLNFSQTNVHITMSVEEQKELQERRRRLLEE